MAHRSTQRNNNNNNNNTSGNKPSIVPPTGNTSGTNSGSTGTTTKPGSSTTTKPSGTNTSTSHVKDSTPKTGDRIDAKYFLFAGVLLIGVYLLVSKRNVKEKKKDQ